ncbi:MAG: prolyl oligopeptidase family serine peptidase [Acidimicrobiales bacterium]
MEHRFRDEDVTLPCGVTGETIEFDSADPVNYHEVISAGAGLVARRIDGKLFVPTGTAGSIGAGASHPAVVITPGSLGVAPSHLAHADALVRQGVAAFVIDPFGARAVTSTVANQTQYSFAASAYDVLAALRTLAARPEVDAARIGAQGHSRGGSAVVTAAMDRYAGAVVGEGLRLRAVYAAYPWCGQQFLRPSLGATTLRAIIGEHDDWCSPQQVQAHVHAMVLCGGDATFRLVAGAGHSFDRETPVEHIAEASVSPHAPTVYLDDDGAMIHPLTGRPDAALTDREVMRYAVKAGFGVRGARIGSSGDQPQVFREDMLGFWRTALAEG